MTTLSIVPSDVIAIVASFLPTLPYSFKLQLVCKDWKVALLQSRERVTSLDFGQLGVAFLTAHKKTSFIFDVLQLYTQVTNVTIAHAELNDKFVKDISPLPLENIIFAFCDYKLRGSRELQRIKWNEIIPTLTNATNITSEGYYKQAGVSKSFMSQVIVDSLNDVPFLTTIRQYNLENAVPVTNVSARFFNPGTTDDGVDYTGNDLSIRNGLYEPWKTIKQFYFPFKVRTKEGTVKHFFPLLHVNDIIDPTIGYTVGHAIMVRLIKSCPVVTSIHTKATPANCEKWFNNDEEVQDYKKALLELIERGLNITSLRDNLRDDTILDMANFLDTEMQNCGVSDSISFAKLFYKGEYKPKYKKEVGKKKRTTKGKKRVVKRKGLLGVYDESEDDDYHDDEEDEQPKKKKTRRTK
jgi:hypothetical protein